MGWAPTGSIRNAEHLYRSPVVAVDGDWRRWRRDETFGASGDIDGNTDTGGTQGGGAPPDPHASDGPVVYREGRSLHQMRLDSDGGVQ